MQRCKYLQESAWKAYLFSWMNVSRFFFLDYLAQQMFGIEYHVAQS